MKTGNTRVNLWEAFAAVVPQWSPVMKTGNTRMGEKYTEEDYKPQWSPVMKTGNTGSTSFSSIACSRKPQWSPVMKTGNTGIGTRWRSPFSRLNGARS